MSAFYDESAAVAIAILTEFGQPIALTQNAHSAYDPQTSTATGTPTVFAGMGAVFDYSQRDMANTEIKQGDRRAYIAPNLGATPATGDTVTLADATVLTVVISRPVAPAGTVVLHDVQLRGV